MIKFLCTYLLNVYIFVSQNHQLKKARSEESSNNSKTVLSIIKIFCTGFSTPETKLFILFWYYVLVVVVLLTHFTVFLYNIGSTTEHLQDYFACSAAAKPNCEILRERAEDNSRPSFYLDLAATMLLCSINMSNLMYVLQFYEIKKFVLRFFKSQNDSTQLANHWNNLFIFQHNYCIIAMQFLVKSETKRMHASYICGYYIHESYDYQPSSIYIYS